MSPRKPKAPPVPEAARRVRHLVSLDARTVVQRLAARQGEMVALFSRLRDRGPLVGVVHSLFQTVSFPDLAQLEPTEQRAVIDFYEHLAALRWYLQYTEDMPLQLQQRINLEQRVLTERHATLEAVLGAPEAQGAPVVEGTVARRQRKR